MRNLKKILALVLALVMSLSLMATAGAKDFTDKADIDATGYQTAVDVLAELEVVRGYEDGSFQPNGDITRAEVAAIIYRIATKDVKDTQQGIYTTWGKFADVKDTAWYAGYVNYCANAQIVKGKTETAFDPEARITGYQVLAMILRTMGYGKNGEFEGSNWAINTAAQAKRIGIIDNVLEQKLGDNATRAMVAEILFNALLTSTVDYNAITGYQPTGKTLGQTQFGLETVTGVVTANEYADLYGASPLREGKTRLVTDEKTYNLDYSTELTDIGEKHHAYIVGGAKVLSMEKTGNTVWENEGKETDISSASKFAKVTGLTCDGETYVNFGGDGDVYKSEYRIAYMFTSVNWEVGADTAAEAVAALKENLKDRYNITAKASELEAIPVTDAAGAPTGKYDAAYTSTEGIRRAFAPGDAITKPDMACIKDIFYYADRLANDTVVKGEVYVGTKSTEDVSDKISYRQFMADYITDVTDYASVPGAENGEWLKVIDNNGDGVADYTFLTTFVMTTIASYNARLDRYTVEYTNQQAAGEEPARNGKGEVIAPSSRLTIDAGDISTDIEELAEGDVILYTCIDGVYYVSAPEVEVNAIDKKGIDYKAETFTCGDKTYEWSGIDYEAYNCYHDVSEAATEVPYDFYLDHFGYIRLYKESAYNQGFVLLTDGYFETDRRTDGYKAQIWNRETEDYEDVVVLNPSHTAEIFIDNEYDIGGKREEGTWKRLLEFGQVYKNAKYPTETADPFRTNIAAYLVDEDGEYVLLPVQAASNRIAYDAHELKLDSGNGTAISPKARTIYCLNDNTRIQTTNDTVYYYVLNPGAKDEKIISWVGYNNAPGSVSLSIETNHVDHAYAVTTPAYTDASYETAEVVVFEAKGWTQSAILAYALDQKMIGENRSFDIYGLGYDDEAGAYAPIVVSGKVTDQNNGETRTIEEKYAPWNISHLVEFYTVDSDGAALNLISPAYAADKPGVYEDYGVYAGYVTTAERVQNRDYITMSKDGTKTSTSHSFYPDSTPTYVVTYNPTAAGQLDYVWTSNTVREERTGNVRTTYDVAESNAFSAGRAGVKSADKVIYVADSRGNVLYAVNVTESQYYNRTIGDYVGVTALEELWQQIADDYAADHETAPDGIDVYLYGLEEGDVTIENVKTNAGDGEVELNSDGDVARITVPDGVITVKFDIVVDEEIDPDDLLLSFDSNWDERDRTTDDQTITVTLMRKSAVELKSALPDFSNENVVMTVEYLTDVVLPRAQELANKYDELTDAEKVELENQKAFLEKITDDDNDFAFGASDDADDAKTAAADMVDAIEEAENAEDKAAAAKALVDAYDDYLVKDGTDGVSDATVETALKKALAAAVDYKDYYVEDSDEDADVDYKALQGILNERLGAVVEAAPDEETGFENLGAIKTAVAALDAIKAYASYLSIASDVEAETAEDAYNAAKEAIEAKASLLTTAKTLVDTYDDYKDAETKTNALWTAYDNAYKAVDELPEADKTLITDSEAEDLWEGVETTPKAAYDGYGEQLATRPNAATITGVELAEGAAAVLSADGKALTVPAETTVNEAYVKENLKAKTGSVYFKPGEGDDAAPVKVDDGSLENGVTISVDEDTKEITLTFKGNTAGKAYEATWKITYVLADAEGAAEVVKAEIEKAVKDFKKTNAEVEDYDAVIDAIEEKLLVVVKTAAGLLDGEGQAADSAWGIADAEVAFEHETDDGFDVPTAGNMKPLTGTVKVTLTVGEGDDAETVELEFTNVKINFVNKADETDNG